MQMPAINAGYTPTSTPPVQGAGGNTQIRSLEQKLQKLSAERQKAVQRKDKKRAEKLEKQIQEIQKQLQQLRQQEKARAQKAGPDAPQAKETPSNAPQDGKYVDAYA